MTDRAKWWRPGRCRYSAPLCGCVAINRPATTTHTTPTTDPTPATPRVRAPAPAPATPPSNANGSSGSSGTSGTPGTTGSGTDAYGNPVNTGTRNDNPDNMPRRDNPRH